MRILIDMDGVLCDYDWKALEIYRAKYPDKPFIPLEERTTFYMKDQYPEELKPLVEEITNAKGFYGSLPVVPGSLEALRELELLGHELFICTSPKITNPYCIQEKFEWVLKHLGKKWTDRLIVTKDKTIVRGAVLIDDKPEITGCETPVWEHILYSRPYNKSVAGKRRLTWDTWKEVFKSL